MLTFWNLADIYILVHVGDITLLTTYKSPQQPYEGAFFSILKMTKLIRREVREFVQVYLATNADGVKFQIQVIEPCA